jgi:regulatory protein
MNKAYNYALGLLAKREYCVTELTNKLEQKGFDSDTISLAFAKLTELNLQSDERYVEMICNARIRQGYGPLRIKQELISKNVASYLIEETLAVEKDNWFEHAISVWHKKYAKNIQYSSKEIQKQKSFLYSRGFSADTIAKVFKEELSGF